MLVEPNSNDKGGLILTARFGLRFIKNTMFRSIITGTTTKEFIAWFKGFGDYVSEALASAPQPMEDNVVAGFPKISDSIHSISKQ